jgi:hypothetical protein
MSAEVLTAAPTRPQSSQLTIERTMILILFMLLFALATRIPLDTDTWWHLRAGEYMVQNRTIIGGDPFSYTRAGEVRVQADWLSQVVLYGLWSVAGVWGLALFTSVLATGGMWLLYRASAGSSYVRAFVMILGAATASVFWSARPQMFTFFLSALIVYLLALYKRQGIDRLWWVIPIMWLWTQLHGGYFIGLLILFGTVGGEILNHLLRSKSPHVIPLNRLGKLAIVSIVSVFGFVIHPAGTRILMLPFETFTMGSLRAYIQEWNAPDLTQPSVWPFVLLALLTFALLVAHWRKVDWTEAALLVGSGYLAITSARNIAFFAVVATPILTYHLDTLMNERGWRLETVKRPTARMVRLNQILLAVVALGMLAKIVLALDPTLVAAAERDIFPVNAVAYLNEAQPQGEMFNSYNWGGYLMVNAPQYKVYIDGRTDLYGELVAEYVDIMTAEEGWQQRLDAYNVNLVVIETESPLAEALRSEPGWEQSYTDDIASVFVRQ